MIWQLMLMSVVLSIAIAEKICEPCPPVPKLYDELGCIGILDDNGCCFERFECRDLNSLDASKCYLKGKTYGDREYAEESDLPFCDTSCRCEAGDEFSRFSCPLVECPSVWFRPTHDNCILMHTVNRCCPNPTCDLSIIMNRTTCEHNGKMYHQGDKFYPEDTPCHWCVCDEHFDSSIPAISNKNCRKIDCGLELRYLFKLQQGCVPIYFKTSSCCPHEFRCPKENDEVIRLETSRNTQIIPEKIMCKFGNHSLHIGESLNSEKPCIKCTCKHPPIVECIKNDYC